MTKLFIVAACSLMVAASACTRTGSTGSERNSAGDTMATAQSTDTAHAPAPHAPVPDPVLPDVPMPQPTGWKEYDSYFDALLRVHEVVIDTSKTIPASALKELQTRANALAKDATVQHQTSAIARKMLADQVKLFTEGPGMDKTNDHVMEAFRPILMASREVLQAPGGSPTHDHADKINVMMIEVDRAIIHAKDLNR
jgi:hypothetical protein